MNMSHSVPTWAIPNLPATSRIADQPKIINIWRMDAFFCSQNNNLKCISTTKNNQEKKTNVQAFPQYCDIRTSVATTIGAWGSGPAVVLLDINHPLFRTRSGCLPISSSTSGFFLTGNYVWHTSMGQATFSVKFGVAFFPIFLPCILSSNKLRRFASGCSIPIGNHLCFSTSKFFYQSFFMLKSFSDPIYPKL